MDLYDYTYENIPEGWEDLFDMCHEEIRHVSNFLNNHNKKFLPNLEDIYGVFKIITPDKVKIIIIGQDPYPSYDTKTKLPYAHGLAFSTREENAIPHSLKNIFKEVKESHQKIDTEIICNCGDLTPWVKQGVFLLNTCLTVDIGVPGSHGGIWLPFIRKVINYLCELKPKIAFILWGEKAKGLIDKVIPTGKHILTAAHPSPLSAYRGNFFGCNHFININKYLKERGEKEIDWNINYI